MKEYVENEGKLSSESRNLLSVAYKNVVGTRRSAWRVVSSMEQKADASSARGEVIKEYKITIEEELKNICGEVIVS